MSNLAEGVTTTAIDPLEYFRDSGTYREPWVTKDTNQNMVACMQPTCECRKQQRNKHQTSGGGFGVITDRRVAQIADTGELISDEEALYLDYDERNTSVLDVHIDCAYWRFRTGITSEMASPSEPTLRTVEGWRNEIYSKDGITKGIMDEVVGAAGVLVQSLPAGEQQDNAKLLAAFAEVYPGRNVHRHEQVIKPVTTYVVSHAVNVVQNQRDRKHPETPMAYFDSLGALTDITRNHGDDRTLKIVRFMNAASILRSAAARTYITRGHDMDLLEVTRRGKKLEFETVTL